MKNFKKELVVLLIMFVGFGSLALTAINRNEKNSEVKTLVLEETNSITIVGAITAESMKKAAGDLLDVASKLKPTDPIYIYMDTTGGLVFSAMSFIEFTRGIPNPIHTVVKSASSMAFDLVQHLGTRYVLESGELMNHRITGTVKGQFDGELETQLAYYKSVFDTMRTRSAKRIGISLTSYKKMILEEYRSVGQQAVDDNVADEVVKVACGASLSGRVLVNTATIMGVVTTEVSKCPLINSISE